MRGLERMRKWNIILGFLLILLLCDIEAVDELEFCLRIKHWNWLHHSMGWMNWFGEEKRLRRDCPAPPLSLDNCRSKRSYCRSIRRVKSSIIEGLWGWWEDNFISYPATTMLKRRNTGKGTSSLASKNNDVRYAKCNCGLLRWQTTSEHHPV